VSTATVRVACACGGAPIRRRLESPAPSSSKSRVQEWESWGAGIPAGSSVETRVETQVETQVETRVAIRAGTLEETPVATQEVTPAASVLTGRPARESQWGRRA